MTYVTYKQRTIHHRRLNRHYRRLVLFLSGIIILLLVLLISSQTNSTSADEMIIKTYQSTVIHSGDSLWSIAEEHKLPDMTVEEYIQDVCQINHLNSSQLISGEYLIIPIYTIPAISALQSE